MTGMDTTQIDRQLRAAMHRLAEPADTAGVVQAVRERAGAERVIVAPVAPRRRWAPALAAASVVAVAAACWFGYAALSREAPVPAGQVTVVGEPVAVTSCTGAGVFTMLEPGVRVQPVGRSGDGQLVAIADPTTPGQHGWIRADQISADDRSIIAGLPVIACPAPAGPSPSAQPSATPSATAAPSPEPSPTETTTTPAAAADTTPPRVTFGSWSRPYICTETAPWGPQTATITATVDDAGTIADVTASVASGGRVVDVARSGSSYTITVQGVGDAAAWAEVFLSATDAAGNLGSATSAAIPSYGPPECPGGPAAEPPITDVGL